MLTGCFHAPAEMSGTGVHYPIAGLDRALNVADQCVTHSIKNPKDQQFTGTSLGQNNQFRLAAGQASLTRQAFGATQQPGMHRVHGSRGQSATISANRWPNNISGQQ
jgi:hypothetical protein